MKTLLLALITFTLLQAAHADIVEIKSMTQISNSLSKNTLLIFDLDNTLIEPVQTLGSDQWFRDLVARGTSAGQTQEAATENALLKWKLIARKTQVRAVEGLTPALVERIQKAGISIIGLTARTADQGLVSFAQLQSVGIDLSKTAGYRRNIPYQNVGGGQGYGYFKGIVFVSPTGDKGQNLLRFLAKTKQHFPRIVFVDDRASNVDSVAAALDGANIMNREFRYGAADARVKSYSPVIADKEWSIFLRTGRIVSDSEVRFR